MKPNASSSSSRRSFLRNGLCIAAPIAAFPLAGASAATADPATAARLAALEDEAQIRAAYAGWLRDLATGQRTASLLAEPDAGTGQTVVGATMLGGADHETIAIAPDGRTAQVRCACVVETVTEMPQDCTFAAMLHQQGGGQVRQSERKLIVADLIRSDAGWSIAQGTALAG